MGVDWDSTFAHNSAGHLFCVLDRSPSGGVFITDYAILLLLAIVD